MKKYIELEDAKKIFNAILNKFKSLNNTSGSSIAPPPNDGNTYGYCNGQWVIICPSDSLIQVQDQND